MKKTITTFFIIFSLGVMAQENSVPKVGLVLSGGGAKGYAHIGVLKVLEEQGIKLDYIGGTSMGAIIGGLYAAGYSANQLDSIVKEQDILELISQPIDRRNKTLLEKKYGENYILNFPLKKLKISLPSGFSSGQGILSLLTNLTLNVHEVDDFSKLPIPFFAIATDLENGQEVILDSGFLPEAMYASGSLPGMLQPMILDGKLLSDGGILNNLPVQKMLDKGVDYIIAVDVQKLEDGKDHLNSLNSVITQMITFQSNQKNYEEYKKVDILIKPKIDAFEVTDFDLQEEIIQSGYEEASGFLKKIKELKNLQKKTNDINVKTNYCQPKVISIQNINVNTTKSYSENFILGRLKIKKGESIDLNKLRRATDRVYGEGEFKLVDYKYNKSTETLEIKVIEENNLNNLRLGIHYDDVYQTGVLINPIFKNLLFNNSTLSLSLILGDQLRGKALYFIDNGIKPSFGFYADYIRQRTNQNLPSTHRFSVQTNKAWIQSTYKEQLAIGAGIKTERVLIREDDRRTPDIENDNYISPYGFFSFDSFDDPDFPTKGLSLRGNSQYIIYSSDDNFETNLFFVFGRAELALPFGKKLTARLGTSFGSVFGGNAPRSYQFYLGGFNKQEFLNSESFLGLEALEVFNKNKIKSDLVLQYNVFGSNYLSFHGNIANLSDDIDDLLFTRIAHHSFGMGYGLKSLIGPIHLIYSYSTSQSQSNWFVSVGHWF